MRINGLSLILQKAIRELNHPLLERYRAAIILGSLREDVWYVPGAGAVIEHFSFSHFYGNGLPGGFIPFLWPGARLKADRFFGQALRAHRAGDVAAAFVKLGRVSHLLSDMACPVHVQRVVHDTDPYEWFIEGNRARLLELAPVPYGREARRASEIVESLSRFTQGFESDRTNSLHGRLLKKAGLRRSLKRDDVAEQAEKIIPAAVGHTMALLELFLREAGVARESGAEARA